MTAVLNAVETAAQLPFPALLSALRVVVQQYAQGEICCPERLVVPLPQAGVMLSMPAVAEDLAVHKLVNVCPINADHSRPTIQGQVSAYEALTGTPLFTLDAPTVTARRTAAVSMLGIEGLHGNPKHVTIIGTGQQAYGHIQALQAIYPQAKLTVVGRTLARATSFAEEFDGTVLAAETIADDTDVVMTTTTSKTPVYHEAARVDRLVIGVGAFTAKAAEIAPHIVQESQLFVDDLVGARHEAGDLILAGVDWEQVSTLAHALQKSSDQRLDQTKPKVFKSVGCAAWDLAACRVVFKSFEL